MGSLGRWLRICWWTRSLVRRCNSRGGAHRAKCPPGRRNLRARTQPALRQRCSVAEGIDNCRARSLSSHSFFLSRPCAASAAGRGPLRPCLASRLLTIAPVTPRRAAGLRGPARSRLAPLGRPVPGSRRHGSCLTRPASPGPAPTTALAARNGLAARLGPQVLSLEPSRTRLGRAGRPRQFGHREHQQPTAQLLFPASPTGSRLFGLTALLPQPPPLSAKRPCQARARLQTLFQKTKLTCRGFPYSAWGSSAQGP